MWGREGLANRDKVARAGGDFRSYLSGHDSLTDSDNDHLSRGFPTCRGCTQVKDAAWLEFHLTFTITQ